MAAIYKFESPLLNGVIIYDQRDVSLVSLLDVLSGDELAAVKFR
ncbi:MAG: hypothetical protein ACI854_000620 [Arenicella sp.]|jgi:hypothetical protein